jgi:hypothetical protein
MSEQSLFTPEEFKKFKKSKGIKRGKQEENLQLAICKYLKDNYPDIIFTCDLASGMKLPIWLAAKNKKMRSSRALPDLFIARPAYEEKIPGLRNLYYGLFIELKREDVRLKNGSIAKSDHHDEQALILARLNRLCYKAVFCCGYHETIKVIDEYLKGSTF